MYFINRQHKKVHSRLKRVVLLILAAGYSITALSQVTDPLPETDIRPVTFSGSLGILSEAYRVSGIDARRPPGMGQIMLNTRFSLFGMSSGFNMIYSTDDNSLRQSMNKFFFHGTWRWLTLSAGDVSPRFSRYSLNGVTVRGGMIELNPGSFHLSATAGRSRRLVEYDTKPGFHEPSFEQWLYGTRIGLGKQGGTQFALSGVYVHDVGTSIENPGNINPAENFSVSPEFNLSLFKGAFFLESNVTVSIFSKNSASKEFDLNDVPGSEFLTGIFSPRASSRVDYAGEVSARFNAGPVRIAGGYERIQPGFMSLGLGHIRSDQEAFRLRPQLRLLKGQINLSANYSNGRNNLLETRISTIKRQQLGTNANLRLGPALNLTLSFMQMQNENNPADMLVPGAAELHQKQVSRNFMMIPTLVFRSGKIAHSVSINTSYQVLDDQSHAISQGTRAPVDFTNFSGGLSYGTSFSSGLSLNTSGNFLRNEMGASKNTGYAVNASTGYAFFERKLTTNILLGWSQNGIEYVQIVDPNDPVMRAHYLKRVTGQLPGNNGIIEGEYVVRQWSRQFMLNLSAAYRLPNGNPLRLMLRGLISKPSEEGGQAYDEMHATLRYEHRF